MFLKRPGGGGGGGGGGCQKGQELIQSQLVFLKRPGGVVKKARELTPQVKS